MRRLVESLGQERRQSLHHSKHNDYHIEEGYVERDVEGRTDFAKSRAIKEQRALSYLVDGT